jgi:hypothetical protein
MKVTRQLDSLEPLVLGQLHGLDGNAWHRGSEGKWSLSQIVEHLAISIDLVATGFEALAEETQPARDATPEQSLMRHMLLGPGKLPEGMEAPDFTIPSERPDPELAQARFRMAVERTRDLVNNWPQERLDGVFVRHPVIGDLNLAEWVRFHYVHCKLHGEQIAELLAWLGHESA